MNLKNLFILLSCAATISSCKNGGLFAKKKEKSDVTGWNYNDKNMGGYQVAREKEQRTGPGLVFVQGGTFTITNGGVFGSMLSTPILNPPQVGILGLHKIEDRPVALNGQVVIRPMMYTALSYDHRIVDGREAVQFLVRVKEFIEDPALFLLEG